MTTSPTTRSDWLKRRLAIGPELLGEISALVLSRGGCLRFKARGMSMRPAIRDGDILHVEPVAPQELRTGDIVFYRTGARRPVAHRVVRRAGLPASRDGGRGLATEGGEPVFRIRGDALPGPAERVGASQILGRVSGVERRGRTVRLTQGWPGILTVFRARCSRWIYRILEPISKLV